MGGVRSLSVILGAVILIAAGRLAAASAPDPAPGTRVATRGDSAAEHLRYVATWNGLPVARAELEIIPDAARRRDGQVTVVPEEAPAGAPGGAPAVPVMLRGKAETNEVLDLLWKMRDSFEATIATGPPRPGHFVLRQRENSRRRETTIVHDPRRGKLVGERRKRGKLRRSTAIPLHRRLHDPASLAYLIRSLPPELDAPQAYEVFEGTKIYRLAVTPAGVSEITALGRDWQARKLELALSLVPTDEDDGDTARRREPTSAADKVQRAEVWISTGPERLPLRMQARTFWGWVGIHLIGRRSLGLTADAA